MVHVNMQAPPPPLVPCEVAWKKAKTYDVFTVLWKYRAKPLADVRYDAQGYRYQRCMAPRHNMVRIQKKLLDLEASAMLYITSTPTTTSKVPANEKKRPRKGRA
jgi:hypothetical protein